jgi:hypothetical protein
MSHLQGAMAATLLCPGQLVAESGIYQAIHNHCERQDLMFLAGQQFPECGLCNDGVRFRPLRLAPRIENDADFRSATSDPPQSLVEKLGNNAAKRSRL